MVIVTSVTGASLIDGTLVDKRTILTTMNILSLQKLEEKVGAIGGIEGPRISPNYVEFLLFCVIRSHSTNYLLRIKSAIQLNIRLFSNIMLQ